MRIEEAIKAMRKGKICRCKNRYFKIINDCLFRLYRTDKYCKYTRIYGVANMHGQDFLTEDWEIMENLVLVTDGSEIY